MVYTLLFFPLQIAVCFIILTYLVPVLFTFYIYSTNIGTEYFKHGIYSPFFSSSKCSLFHNSNLFGSCIIHIVYIYSQTYVLNILNMVILSVFFFFSKCSLFHNSNVFGFCIITILYTKCAKIKKLIPAPKC